MRLFRSLWVNGSVGELNASGHSYQK